MRLISSFLTGRLAGWLAAGICVSVALLSWFGYHAILEWRHSAVMLAERRSSEAADLLLEALTRDMRGVQESVLTSPQWSQFANDRPFDMSSLVASTFARYPYPESFFAWHGGKEPETIIFFDRSDRRPRWMTTPSGPSRFPVVIEREPAVARAILDRIVEDAARGRSLSAFEMTIRGVRFQIVARLTYEDAFREHLEEVVGFTVDLPWVRDNYFSELTKQVWEIGGGAEKGLTLSVTDGLRRQVAGSPVSNGEGLTSQRKFALLFFNPDAVPDPLDTLSSNPWMVEVSAAGDPALSQAISGANRTLTVGAAAALALAVGLVLTARAERASAKFVELRSDFVSTVTHELKTPIATIRAAAETLSQGRLNGIEAFQAYGRLVVAEAKRLTRLVENLLAYSRITDIADIYTFESLDVAMLFGDIQQEFQAQLDEAGFELEMDIPPATPPIRGDRVALRLLFDNLIDNALRYSGNERRLRLRARAAPGAVTIEVVDWGIGIPSDEIHLVTRKFVRGRRAPSGGSGLGLAIASRIAGDHGGQLVIRSTLGAGTTVSVQLPVAQA